MENEKLFKELTELIHELQTKCPHSSTLTLENQKKELINEAIEARTAVNKKDWQNLKEELGDVLWDWMTFCWIAEQKGLFKTSQVLEILKQKIKRRNPHIFGNATAKSKEEALKLKEKAKKQEKEFK